MPQKDASAHFVLSTDPMLASIGEVTEDKFELVYIHGRIGRITDDTVHLHQGLDLRKRYEIPRCEIVYVQIVTCSEGNLTQIVLFSTTRITYVSGQATATLPASALPVCSSGPSKIGSQKAIPEAKCPTGCLCNGKCCCASIDYWFTLDDDTAKKLGVVVSKAPSGTK
jgi:hypothetical protein